MTQISKHLLPKDIEEEMFDVFWQSVASVKNKKEAEKFFSELLTKTERVMLAKRLAIAVLLIRRYKYDQIKSLLKVSSCTISRVRGWLESEGEGYRFVINRMFKRRAWKEFLEGIEKTLYDLHPYLRHPSDFRKKRTL